jgi:hypothetical protein
LAGLLDALARTPHLVVLCTLRALVMGTDDVSKRSVTLPHLQQMRVEESSRMVEALQRAVSCPVIRQLHVSYLGDLRLLGPILERSAIQCFLQNIRRSDTPLDVCELSDITLSLMIEFSRTSSSGNDSLHSLSLNLGDYTFSRQLSPAFMFATSLFTVLGVRSLRFLRSFTGLSPDTSQLWSQIFPDLHHIRHLTLVKCGQTLDPIQSLSQTPYVINLMPCLKSLTFDSVHFEPGTEEAQSSGHITCLARGLSRRDHILPLLEFRACTGIEVEKPGCSERFTRVREVRIVAESMYPDKHRRR